MRLARLSDRGPRATTLLSARRTNFHARNNAGTPVKHGLVAETRGWECSLFRQCAAAELYPAESDFMWNDTVNGGELGCANGRGGTLRRGNAACLRWRAGA